MAGEEEEEDKREETKKRETGARRAGEGSGTRRAGRLIKMLYLQAVPGRITRPPLQPPPFFLFPLLPLPRPTRSISTLDVAPTANGEIMIKPTSFQ